MAAMEAVWWDALDGGLVRCQLCPNRCVIAPGERGVCKIRVNRDGMLIAAGYGEVVSIALDPVEKKPLYHFYPGRQILSTGANGCNFRCGFCQNSDISQKVSPTRYMSPEHLARMAGAEGSIGVAYTYTEPFVWFEYIRDAGRLIHERGLVNVLVTNGYVSEGPLREILPIIDALNIDLKAIRPEFYKRVCAGDLATVQRTIEIAAQSSHVEITTLIIPGYNDTDDDFGRLADWVAGVNPLIPLHFSRYFPRYRFDAPPTPTDTIARACEIARARLSYVYAGNCDIPGGSDTRCPGCSAILIRREQYTAQKTGILKGHCAACGRPVDAVGL